MRKVLKQLGSKRVVVAATSVIALSILTVIRAADPALLTAVRELTFDNYQRLSPRNYEPAPVRIVDIDEASIAEFGQWPWPRSRLAELTNALNEMGAAVIAYDVIFSEPDRTSPQAVLSQLPEPLQQQQNIRQAFERLPDNDTIFAAALAQAPSVVGFALVPTAQGRTPQVKTGFAFGGRNPSEFLPPFKSTLLSLPALETAAAGSGGVSLSVNDRGGVVRRVPLIFTDGTSLYPSLSTEALRVAQGAGTLLVRSTGASNEVNTGRAAVTDVKIGAFSVPTNTAGEMWVHFTPEIRERYVSVKDVLDPAKRDVVLPLIESQIIFVGTSAAGLLDLRATPLMDLTPGVSIHAQAIEQILSGDFLTRPDWTYGAEIILTFLVGSAIILAFPAIGSIGTGVFGGMLAAGLVGGSFYMFKQDGLLIDPVYPSLASLLVFAVATSLLYFMTEREKRFVRQAFSQYLSPELVHQLEDAPEQLVLGGEMRPMTILFMDVRGFTPISEQLTPTELVSFLNTLLSPLSDIIQAEGGTIDKYIGDSIMAFWNAPVTIENHASHACRAALAMIERVEELNRADAFGFKARGLKTQNVQIGIGLNTGEACVGNMGSDRRFNYSVIGDAVNVASRIESSCKAVGAELLVSEHTRQAAHEFAYLEAGEIPLKGKSEPVKLFALVGGESLTNTGRFSALSSYHSAMINALKDGDPNVARERLLDCKHHTPEGLGPFYAVFETRVAALEGATDQVDAAV
ncbi:CHASE2 domain-containing protein [Roseibium sp.]|uniref:CHASE2 domain-containing protein n=1 Tax=Roseibium sp. TaxID=1936156 RepID=UPI003A973CCC